LATNKHEHKLNKSACVAVTSLMVHFNTGI